MRFVNRFRHFWREFRAEVKGRRQGRRAVPRGAHPVRDIVGPTGYMWSAGWTKAAEGSEAYTKSFDRQLPPSTHISHRDATRANQAMPLAERCIEDWANPVPYADPHEGLDLSADRPPATRGREG